MAILRVDDYVNRVYYAPGRYGAGLYIGYYRSQRQGDSIHSPLNCMPGAGWEPVSQRPLSISVPNAGDGRQHLGEPIRDPEGHRSPAGALLVSKPRAGRGERVLEQVLSDSRRGSPQPHRCGAGTSDCADARPIWRPANPRPRSRRSSSSAPCFRCCPPTCLPESRPCTCQYEVPSSLSAAPPSSVAAAASLRRRNTCKRGKTYFDQANYQNAILEFRMALQADPKLGDVRLKLGDAYLRANEPANGLREYIRAADLLPNSVDAQVKAGQMLLVARAVRGRAGARRQGARTRRQERRRAGVARERPGRLERLRRRRLGVSGRDRARPVAGGGLQQPGDRAAGAGQTGRGRRDLQEGGGRGAAIGSGAPCARQFLLGDRQSGSAPRPS